MYCILPSVSPTGFRYSFSPRYYELDPFVSVNCIELKTI